MPSYRPTIAIVGLTGSLGPSLIEAFTSISSSLTLPIRAISRSVAGRESSETIQYLAVDYTSPSELEAALQGVDVVVDVLNGPGIDKVHKALVDAAEKIGVKVFFPSKFGADYREDTVYVHPSYALNKEVVAYAEAHISKVVRVYLGLFEDAVTKFLFPPTATEFEVVGTGDETFSCTSRLDVARSVAQLSLHPPKNIPEHVYLSGSTVSSNIVIDALEEERTVAVGQERRPVKHYSIPDAREHYRDLVNGVGHSTVAAPSYVFMLKSYVGEGWFDYSNVEKNHNELVNPGESLWKWARWTKESGRET